MITRCFYALCCIVLIACSASGGFIEPVLERGAFDGFDLTAKQTDLLHLQGYEFQTDEGGALRVVTCNQALEVDAGLIPEHEYFRFNVLLTDCAAAQQFPRAEPSQTAPFPHPLTPELVRSFPAAVIPLLSEAHQRTLNGTTLGAHDNTMLITVDQLNVAHIQTENDEIYITVMARGDFTGDRIEDLLVKTEWFAGNGYGKHVDLLVLSQSGEDGKVNVEWRLRPIETAP